MSFTMHHGIIISLIEEAKSCTSVVLTDFVWFMAYSSWTKT